MEPPPPPPPAGNNNPNNNNNNNSNLSMRETNSSDARKSGESGPRSLWPPQTEEEKRVSISASLQGSGGGRESSYYDYSPILEKATQVDLSSSSGFPNYHDSSSADSSFQRSSDDTVPSISRQVSINMVRETTQRMETLLGELKDLRRSTSEQRSSNLSRNTTNRDSAYTSGSGSSLRYGKQRRTVSSTAAVQPSTTSSQHEQQSPVFVDHQTHPVKAPPTPPRTLEDEQHMQHQPQLLKTPPPQPQRSASVASHARSHSLPVSMATHIATRPLTLSPLKNNNNTNAAARSPSSSSQQQRQHHRHHHHSKPHTQPHKNHDRDDDKEEEDLDGLMSSLDSYRDQLDRLNGNRGQNNNNNSSSVGGESRTPSPNNYISAPSSPAFMKNIGQPPSAKPPPPPANPPSLPATWQQQPSLKEEMDYLLDVPSAPFLDKRASHDSSTESFTTAQSPSDKEEEQQQQQQQQLDDDDENTSSCERTETGDVSHSSGHTLRGATAYYQEQPLPPPPPPAPLRDSVYSSSSPILGPLNQHTQPTRQLASPVKDQPSRKSKSRADKDKEKEKERRREKKREKRREQPSATKQQRPFSQPNIQQLMDMSNNSFRLDQIDLPPDERHLLEKFIDALSKLSVEINLDERKKVEGKRRLQNALRAIEGWI